MADFFPKHYQCSSSFFTSGQTAVVIPSLQILVDETSLESFSDITLDLTLAASWDAVSPTDYTVAANRAGKDFYIFCVAPELGKTPKLLLSANSTYPSGYTADSSRKIGGFHCLCLSVGTITNHTLTGYLTGSVIPSSLWSLSHRCANHNNAGMVYDDVTGKWYGIYLPSLSGSNAVSVYNATISDTITWMDAVDKCANSSTRLLKDHEFTACATGSPERTNIYGSADPVTTGGHVNTASVRIISNIGCEDCTGVLWQWLDEHGYRFDGATAHTHIATANGEPQAITSGVESADTAPAWSWKNNTGGKGQLYTQGTYGDVKLVAGGHWSSGTICGSLARNASCFRWYSDSYFGFRFCCESKEL